MRRCSIIRDYGVWPGCATCFIVCTHREQCSSIFEHLVIYCQLTINVRFVPQLHCALLRHPRVRNMSALSLQSQILFCNCMGGIYVCHMLFATFRFWFTVTLTKKLWIMVVRSSSFSNAHTNDTLVQNTCPSVYCNVKSGWEFYYCVGVRGDMRRKAYTFPFTEDVTFFDACWHRPVQTTLHTAHHMIDFYIFAAQTEAMVFLIQEV